MRGLSGEWGGTGWDSQARLVGERWVERRPRRPEVAARLLMETRLLPWLAPRLPLPVPSPHVLRREPLVVRHEVIAGEPLGTFDAVSGRALGAFLRALHATDPVEAARQGAPPAEEALRERAATVKDFGTRVVPLLPEGRRGAARALLDGVAALPATALVHGDLGPEHVLTRDGVVSGVIDFCDAHVGDPALDLAWPLHGAPPVFARAVGAEYGAVAEVTERALLWHRLGPWHEVTHGLGTGDPDMVRSGLDGLLARLPA
ncbi:phosphotransferase [Microbispora cellulosiformans]|uniref:Phosphotransferase n=1 Tax=Microbispora cellulosiformans TaxID=2614688 RepID=A0A5J5JT20_9ACTN|nr:phosphotransferase [Microbispora cellulosiformans]KAA9374273.1 phosphotransferase [Microbispora cellulosiformans]